MDYESRKIKWYWFLLFLIFCGVAVYLLFQANPYLYSHVELRTALNSGESLHRLTIPANPVKADKTGENAFYTRYGFDHAAIDPVSGPRSKNYEEYEHFKIDSGIPKWDVKNVVQDSTGFYLSGKNPWIVAVDLQGKVRWKFRFKDEALERDLYPPLIDEASVYAVHPSGEVVCLNKTTGEIRWVMDLREDLGATPLLWKENLLLPVRLGNGMQLILMNRLDGKVLAERKKLDLKPGFEFSYSRDLNMLIATVDAKVVGIQIGRAHV